MDRAWEKLSQKKTKPLNIKKYLEILDAINTKIEHTYLHPITLVQRILTGTSLTIFYVFQRPTFKWYFMLLNMRRGCEQYISIAYMLIAAYELYTMLQINIIHSTKSNA